MEGGLVILLQKTISHAATKKFIAGDIIIANVDSQTLILITDVARLAAPASLVKQNANVIKEQVGEGEIGN